MVGCMTPGSLLTPQLTVTVALGTCGRTFNFPSLPSSMRRREPNFWLVLVPNVVLPPVHVDWRCSGSGFSAPPFRRIAISDEVWRRCPTHVPAVQSRRTLAGLVYVHPNLDISFRSAGFVPDLSHRVTACSMAANGMRRMNL